MACAPTPSGQEYVRVVDYRAGQFTLIPKTPEAERARVLGRTVHLARDREGRLSLQLFLVPVFGLILAMALFREPIGMLETAGTAIVVLGIGLVARESWRSARTQPVPRRRS